MIDLTGWNRRGGARWKRGWADAHIALPSASVSDHEAVLPPLILTIWPVMKDALSEARNTMASAISSGFAPRLSGTAAKNAAFLSGVPVRRSSIAVSVGPGATA